MDNIVVGTNLIIFSITKNYACDIFYYFNILTFHIRINIANYTRISALILISNSTSVNAIIHNTENRWKAMNRCWKNVRWTMTQIPIQKSKLSSHFLWTELQICFRYTFRLKHITLHTSRLLSTARLNYCTSMHKATMWSSNQATQERTSYIAAKTFISPKSVYFQSYAPSKSLYGFFTHVKISWRTFSVVFSRCEIGNAALSDSFAYICINSFRYRNGEARKSSRN